MAYKNQKKNRDHIKKLKKVAGGWRRKQRNRIVYERREAKIRHLVETGCSPEVARRAVYLL